MGGYPLSISIPVLIIYGIGIACGLGILIKVWWWVCNEVVTLLKFKKAFIEFLIEKKNKKKIVTPTIKED